MKKQKMLAQAIVLGLLLAAPVGAWAEGITSLEVDGEAVNKEDTDIVVNAPEQNFGNSGEYRYTSIVVKNGGELTIKGTNLTFESATKATNNPNSTPGTSYNAMVLAGNAKTTIDVDNLYIGTNENGSGDKGGDRGFRLTGANNELQIYANKIVSYTGDEFIHVRSNAEKSVAHIGSKTRRVDYFEAHSGWGKGDYGVALLQANEGGTINLYANTVILDGSSHEYGGVIGTGGWGTVNVDAKNLTIDGNICGSYGLMSKEGTTATFNITAETLNMKGDVNVGSFGKGYSNFSRDTEVTINVVGTAEINGNINVQGNAGSNANTSDESTLTINFNGDSVITGDINVKGSESNQNATVNLGGTGDMTASKGVYNVENSGNVNFTGGTWAVKEWKGDNTGDVGISSGADVKVSASAMNIKSLELDGTMSLTGGAANVVTKTLKGANSTVATDSLDNKLTVTDTNDTTNLTVKGNGDIADAIAADSTNAAKLAKVVTYSNGASAANELAADAGVISGGYSARIGDGGAIVDAETYVNTDNQAVSNMASISLMTWRAENNDMNKRLGELRDSKGEHGVWARMTRGESKYSSQNIKNQYNSYQLGYDEKLSVDPNWTVGAALSYTDGQSSFGNGSGENKHTGFAVYGSYLSESGSFIDLIAKYARLKHDFDVNGGIGSGDYETNGYSVSAEYGKRFTKDNGLWIEPQVELTYGKVGSVNYLTDNGADVRQDGMDSLVGRLGLALGKDIKQGNVYVRASYLYDFDGETNVTMSKSGASSVFEQDLGGGWWEVGVGTNLNLSDATHLYFDVEKTYGGNVATPWQWNAGVRWSF